MAAIIIREARKNDFPFDDVEAAIRHVQNNGGKKVTIYSPQDVYDRIFAETVMAQNQEDYDELRVLRSWKAQASSWSDINDLNDTRDEIRERIARRTRRVQFGGETETHYSPRQAAPPE